MNNLSSFDLSFDFITEDGIQLNGLSNINESLSIHYIIYRIDNLINGKYYIGQHKTTNPYDDYMGSGILIGKAKKKYGISAFCKTILFDYDNFKDMDAKETELVPLSSCSLYNEMSYNIREGGYSGTPIFSDETRKKMSESARKKFKHAKETSVQWYINYIKKQSELSRGENNPMYGKTLSDYMELSAYKIMRKKSAIQSKINTSRPEYRQKQSQRFSGKNNPMYGHSCKEYMSDSDIRRWKQNLSKANKGENNPMYGKSSWAKCTPEEKRIRSDKFRKSMIGKNKGRKVLKHKETGKIISVMPDKVEEMVMLGYEPYSCQKGKRAMVNPTTNKLKLVSSDEFSKYLLLGYVFKTNTKNPKLI